MKAIFIILALGLFSCKKVNCNCGHVMQTYKEQSKVVLKNTCSNEYREFAVSPYLIDTRYVKGEVVCDDENIQWI